MCSLFFTYWCNWQYSTNTLYWCCKHKVSNSKSVGIFAAHCLFVRIAHSAEERGNGNMFFKMAARFKNKRTSIITVRDQYLTFAMFPAPLTSRWSLPLKSVWNANLQEALRRGSPGSSPADARLPLPFRTWHTTISLENNTWIMTRNKIE